MVMAYIGIGCCEVNLNEGSEQFFFFDNFIRYSFVYERRLIERNERKIFFLLPNGWKMKWKLR